VVARLAGLDASYLSRIETGKVHPTVRMVQRIAAALRISFPELMGPSPPERKDRPCPVSPSGLCFMDLLDSGPGSALDVDKYTRRQLRLLQQFAELVQSSNPSLMKAFETLFGKLQKEKKKRRR
jgi:transcriptional regulator with XRE-family HTH domain